MLRWQDARQGLGHVRPAAPGFAPAQTCIRWPWLFLSLTFFLCILRPTIAQAQTNIQVVSKMMALEVSLGVKANVDAACPLTSKVAEEHIKRYLSKSGIPAQAYDRSNGALVLNFKCFVSSDGRILYAGHLEVELAVRNPLLEIFEGEKYYLLPVKSFLRYGTLGAPPTELQLSAGISEVDRLLGDFSRYWEASRTEQERLLQLLQQYPEKYSDAMKKLRNR
jgi:hypothetical protein